MVLAVVALLFQVGAAQPAVSAASQDAPPQVTTQDTGAPRLPKLENVKLRKAPSLSEKSDSEAQPKIVAYNTPTNSQSFSTIRVPDINASKQSEIKPFETYPSRRWFALSIAQSAAAGFDAYSTRYAVGH